MYKDYCPCTPIVHVYLYTIFFIYVQIYTCIFLYMYHVYFPFIFLYIYNELFLLNKYVSGTEELNYLEEKSHMTKILTFGVLV